MGKDEDFSTVSVNTAIARFYRGNKVIGAGFRASSGYVFTCAHVVRDALAWKSEEMPIGQKLKINFPHISLKKKVNAEVVLYRLMKDDDEKNQDIAALKILEPFPGEVLPINFLPHYQLQCAYKVEGFPSGHPKGIRSYGQIVDREPLASGWMQLEDTKAQGLAISPGFSGAPVWDEDSCDVVGMVVARDKENPDAKIGFMIPAITLMTYEQELHVLGLEEILADHFDELIDVMQQAFHLLDLLDLSMSPTLSETIASLQDAKQGDRPFSVLDQFVAFLSLPTLNLKQDLQEQLQHWLKTRVGERLPSLLKIAQERVNAGQPEPSIELKSHLLIYVQEGSSHERAVSALFIRDESQCDMKRGEGIDPVKAPKQEPFNEKVTQETLSQLVPMCIKEVLMQGPQNLTLHLTVPLEWLHQTYEHCAITEAAEFPFLPDVSNRLGIRFCCVLRITERLHPQILGLYEELWKTKWKDLLKTTQGQAASAFVLGDHLSGNELVASLVLPKHVGLKLSKVREKNQYVKLFGALIASGTAAAIWLRHDQFCESICGIDELDKLLSCNMSTLPEIIKQCRSNAMAELEENAHIGHHIAFLWENPDLNPLSASKSIGMA